MRRTRVSLWNVTTGNILPRADDVDFTDVTSRLQSRKDRFSGQAYRRWHSVPVWVSPHCGDATVPRRHDRVAAHRWIYGTA